MKCLVTGAAGFVGSSICDRLLLEGHSVLGVDRFLDYYPRAIKERNLRAAKEQERFEFRELDLLAADLDELVDGVDWIFHQAAQAGVRASWGQYFQTYTDNNILATQRLLESVRAKGHAKKIVYASSSSVYGNAETLPTSEEIRPQPVSPYGVTKLAAEHLMSLYATEFQVPTISLRYFTVYGPRQRPDMAFHKFIRAAKLGESLELYGDGEQSRDFTFIDDIVEANLRAAACPAHGEVLNVGGGSRVTINQVFTMLESIVGKMNIDRKERQVGDARHTGADTSRLASLLDFQPKVSLEEGLAKEAAYIESLLNEGL